MGTHQPHGSQQELRASGTTQTPRGPSAHRDAVLEGQDGQAQVPRPLPAGISPRVSPAGTHTRFLTGSNRLATSSRWQFPFEPQPRSPSAKQGGGCSLLRQPRPPALLTGGDGTAGAGLTR